MQTARESSHPTIRLKVRLHPGQKEVRLSAARFKVLAAGRRWGKTRLAAGIGFEKAATGGVCWWVAPDFPRATIGWRILRRMALQVPTVIIRDADRRIEFPNGGVLQVKSGHESGALRGEGLDYLIVDEAAFLEEERWTAELRPALADRGGGALFISTFAGENWFFGLHARGEDPAYPEWEGWRKPTAGNPYIDPAEIEDARLSMSEAEFAQEFLALPSAGADAIFERGMFAGERYDAADLSYRNSAVARYVAFDTAFLEKESADFTAYTVLDLMADYRVAVSEVGAARVAFPELLSMIEDVAVRHDADGKLRAVVIEQAASGQSAIQSLQAASGPLAGYIAPFKVGGAKKTERAREAAIWCRKGCVMLPEPSGAVPWLADFEQEVFSFPATRNDDMTDSFTTGVLYLSHLLAEGYRVRHPAVA